MATNKAAKKATRKVSRSAKSGAFVSKATAKANPETTVTETVSAEHMETVDLRIPASLADFLAHMTKSGFFPTMGAAAAHMITEYTFRCWLASNPYGGE